MDAARDSTDDQLALTSLRHRNPRLMTPTVGRNKAPLAPFWLDATHVLATTFYDHCDNIGTPTFTVKQLAPCIPSAQAAFTLQTPPHLD